MPMIAYFLALLFTKWWSVEYDLPTAEAQVRDLDAIVEKLNTTFQQELKDEVEAENFFLN